MCTLSDGNARVPDLPLGGSVSVYRQPDTSDLASEQLDPSSQSKHYVVSWSSTMHCPVDLAAKSNLCLQIGEHKQEQERMQQNCRCIELTELGSQK